MKRLLFILLLLASPAWAQSRIDQLGAGAAVSGTDSFPACQGCGASTAAVGVTASQLKTFTNQLVLISTQPASNSATLQWTGLGSTYNSYFLDCNGIIPSAGSSPSLTLQFGEGATPTWEVASYFSNISYSSSGSASTSYSVSESAAGIIVGLGAANTSSGVGQSKVWIANIASAAVYKTVIGQSTSFDGTHVYASSLAGTYHGDTGVVTAIRVLMSTGNITSGQCSLYGLVP